MHQILSKLENRAHVGINKFEEINCPGGGLGIPTDRDQQSWVFLNDPQKYFASDSKPQEILS